MFLIGPRWVKPDPLGGPKLVLIGPRWVKPDPLGGPKSNVHSTPLIGAHLDYWTFKIRLEIN